MWWSKLSYEFLTTSTTVTHPHEYPTYLIWSKPGTSLITSSTHSSRQTVLSPDINRLVSVIPSRSTASSCVPSTTLLAASGSLLGTSSDPTTTFSFPFPTMSFVSLNLSSYLCRHILCLFTLPSSFFFPFRPFFFLFSFSNHVRD